MPAWRNAHELYRAAWKCPTRIEDDALIIKVPYKGDLSEGPATAGPARKKNPHVRRVDPVEKPSRVSQTLALDREAVIRHLAFTDNKTETAKAFGISASTLYNRLREWGIRT